MKMCTELYAQRRLAAADDVLWSTGQTVRVQLYEGNNRQRDMVVEFASEWMEHGNIKLEFTVISGIIRVGFRAGQGSWSYVGRSALVVDNRTPTMNFGWLTDDCSEEEARRVILHEFGHALGMIHEHQSPAASIPWDEDKLYEFYAGPPNFWSREVIYENIVKKYHNGITNSIFDPESIMLYPIVNELTVGDYEVGWNRELSHQDKEFFGNVYPS